MKIKKKNPNPNLVSPYPNTKTQHRVHLLCSMKNTTLVIKEYCMQTIGQGKNRKNNSISKKSIHFSLGTLCMSREKMITFSLLTHPKKKSSIIIPKQFPVSNDPKKINNVKNDLVGHP